MNSLKSRRAGPKDAFAIMRLYQEDRRIQNRRPDDPRLVNIRLLEQDLEREEGVWAVLEGSDGLEAFSSMDIESDSRLGKIRHMAALGGGNQRAARLDALLGFLMSAASGARTEVVFSTTRTMSLEDQAATIRHGFHVLGVFPTAISADDTRLNGLTVWYADAVLSHRRYCDFLLHPAMEPLYELARVSLGLKPLGLGEAPNYVAGDPAPALELIEAELFVGEKFRQLRRRMAVSQHFYPFQSPNAVITSPDGGIEVYLALLRPRRMAVLIAEHLAAAVDPVPLYRGVAQVLYESGIRYVEVINDAADIAGIDCILRAGYAPCGYFPCLKSAGELRRDYVVFAKSFDFFTYKPLSVDPAYTAFLQEFCRARNTVPGVYDVLSHAI